MTVKALIKALELYEGHRQVRISSHPSNASEILSVYDCNREPVVWIDIEEIQKKKRRHK